MDEEQGKADQNKQIVNPHHNMRQAKTVQQALRMTASADQVVDPKDYRAEITSSSNLIESPLIVKMKKKKKYIKKRF